MGEGVVSFFFFIKLFFSEICINSWYCSFLNLINSMNLRTLMNSHLSWTIIVEVAWWFHVSKQPRDNRIRWWRYSLIICTCWKVFIDYIYMLKCIHWLYTQSLKVSIDYIYMLKGIHWLYSHVERYPFISYTMLKGIHWLYEHVKKVSLDFIHILKGIHWLYAHFIDLSIDYLYMLKGIYWFHTHVERYPFIIYTRWKALIKYTCTNVFKKSYFS